MRAQRIVREVENDVRGNMVRVREVKLDDDGNRVEIEREITRGAGDEIVEIIETIRPYVPSIEERSAARLRGLEVAREQYRAHERSRPDSYRPADRRHATKSR